MDTGGDPRTHFFDAFFPRSQKSKITQFLNQSLGLRFREAEEVVRRFAQTSRHMTIHLHAPEAFVSKKLVRLMWIKNIFSLLQWWNPGTLGTCLFAWHGQHTVGSRHDRTSLCKCLHHRPNKRYTTVIFSLKRCLSNLWLVKWVFRFWWPMSNWALVLREV